MSIAGELITFGSVMAGKLNKSSKQILSILFHLAVLVSMVIAYDAVKAIIVSVSMESGVDADEAEGKDSGFIQKLKDVYRGVAPEAENVPEK